MLDETRNTGAVYAYIGQRIRQRRKMLQLNQTQLAEMMGFSYQQMQKYESGSSHVSAGKLLLLAKVLNVPPAYFYEGIALDDNIGKRLETNFIQKTRTDPLRVLLVDESPSDVILFMKAMNGVSEQLEVRTIHDPQLVMEHLLNHGERFGGSKTDIVIVECLSKSGVAELIRMIKKNPRTQMLPIIALTRSVSVKDLHEMYKHGVASFIQKSVDLDEYTRSLEVFVRYWARIVSLPQAA